MKVLKGILKESREYYRQIKAEILDRLANLPKGSIKERRINKQIYHYLQFRKGPRVIHEYLGKEKPKELIRKLKERQHLEDELKKVKQSLRVLKRLKGRKRKSD